MSFHQSLSPRSLLPVLLFLSLVLGTTPALAAGGFSMALDLGGGPFKADPQNLDSRIDSAHAKGFTSLINEHWTPAAALRLGWNFFGHASLEATLTGTTWYPSDRPKTGGGGFAGGRVTWFPLELFHPLKIADLRERNYDFGVSFGSGYTLLGGPKYGMAGAYLEYGALALFFPLKWLSVGAFYRYHSTLFDTFYYNFYEDQKDTVDQSSIGWHTLGLTIGVHFQPR